MRVYEPVGVGVQMVVGGAITGGSVVSSVFSSGGTLEGGVVTSGGDPGSVVTLRALPRGDLIDPVSSAFQWYRQTAGKTWSVIKGAMGPTLTVSKVAETEEGYYRVRAFGKVNGGVDSEAIRLRVNDPVAFAAGMKSRAVTLVSGESTVLTVNATGSDVHYQWWKDGVVVGNDSSMLVINNASALSAGTYGVVLSNGFSRAGAKGSSVAEPRPETGPFEVARVSVQSGPGLEKISVVRGSVDVGGAGVLQADTVLVEEGEAFALGVKVSGSAAVPLSYQWRKNGVMLAGKSGKMSVLSPSANGMKLEVGAAGVGDGGVYDVVVSNALGSTVSEPVSVVVDAKPVITREPVDVLASEGSAATFRVEASGTGLSYAWWMSEKGDFVVKEEVGNEPLLPLVNVRAGMSGRYVRAVVSKRMGDKIVSVTSRAAKLTVTTAGDIVIGDIELVGLSENGVALPGTEVRASVKVKGSGTLGTRWRRNGVELGGEMGSGVVGTEGKAEYKWSVKNESGGVYDVVVSNGADVAYSKPVTLVVDPRIESYEGPTRVNPGDGIRYQVKAASVKALKYQWLKRSGAGAAWKGLTEDGRVSGVQSDTLSVKAAVEGDAGDYRVEVRYGDGSQPSVVAVQEWSLVVAGLKIEKQPEGLTLEEGKSGTLKVVAQNASGYRWMKDGEMLEGGKEGSLVVNAGTSVAGVFSGAGIYQVEVWNSGGALRSEAVRVTVKEAMKVRIEGPREAALGSSVNLVAEGVGSGTLTYAWTKDGKAVGSGRRLRISPVGVGDGGLYRVEMSDGKTVVRGELEMAVKNVPQILVGPATQTIGSGRKGRLFVVARYAGGLAYQWYKNGEKINGATGVQWSVSGDGVSESGDAYTVRVSSATESEVYVEASAKVTKGGSGSGSGTSGGEGVEVEGIGSVERAQWWVYSAQAKGNRWTSGERNEEADRLGYWVVERVEDKGSGETRRVEGVRLCGVKRRRRGRQRIRVWWKLGRRRGGSIRM